MNRAILTILTLLNLNTAIAQSVAKNNIYLSQELNLGNLLGLNLGINYDFNEKQTVKAGYDVNFGIPQTRPDDYSQSLIRALVHGKEIPLDRMETFQLCFGHIYNLRNDASMRIKLSFGVGYSIIRQPEAWQLAEEASLAGGNYSWEYGKRGLASLIINPKLEVPLTTDYGITFSPVLQMNKEIVYYGLSFGQIIGIMD